MSTALCNDELVTLTTPANYIIVIIIIIALHYTPYFIHAYLYHISANKSVVYFKNTHLGSPHDADSISLILEQIDLHVFLLVIYQYCCFFVSINYCQQAPDNKHN